MDFSKTLNYELVRAKIKNMYILIRDGKVIVNKTWQHCKRTPVFTGVLFIVFT